MKHKTLKFKVGESVTIVAGAVDNHAIGDAGIVTVADINKSCPYKVKARGTEYAYYENELSTVDVFDLSTMD